MKTSPFIGLLLALSSFPAVQGQYQPIAPFLEKYCVECHGPDEVKGGVRLDNVREIDAQLWVDIYDQLDEGEMPPKKATQPPEGLLKKMIALVDTISRDEQFTMASGYRRLNKREYRNTVRDLLGLSGEFYDPAAAIFDDEIEKGFDTNSESLSISNDLLLEYLRSSTISLKTALFTDATEEPPLKKTTFHSKQLTVQGQLSGKPYDHVIQRQRKGGIFPAKYDSVIPTTGKYRITAVAAGLNRHPSIPAKGTPFRMSLQASFAGTTKVLEEFEIQDDTFSAHEAVVWLEKGALPFFQGVTISPKPRNINRRRGENDKLPIPGLAIKTITIEGPLDVEWPPRTYKTIYQTEEMPDLTDEATRKLVLRNFISRAFRRQVDHLELGRYNEFLEAKYKEKKNWQEAFIRTFSAIMASTDFLYIKEDIGELEPFQLASRLSYFIWASMPDLELLRLANSGDLLDPDVFRGQLVRMIKDPKSKGFAEGFAMQWLSLDELGTMRPSEDDKQYKTYYRNQLESAMRDETMSFFLHILFENQPITDFLDSDYTFLNKALADHYGIPFQGGEEMERVQIPAGSVRGGLLGQASIHAITSNGVETLPVTRGHWVLDELMGTPPPPPPEEVPAIVPDQTGATTPRELLQVHREDPTCFACHKVMDPAGLALESFDIIGRYRDRYRKGGPRIDTTGNYQGIEFSDVPGLRKALLEDKDTFTYNFIVKLVEYGKGRKLNRKDHETVKLIANKAEIYDYQFLYILGEILMSDLMRQR